MARWGAPRKGRGAGCFQLEGQMREEAVTRDGKELPPALLRDLDIGTFGRLVNFFAPWVPSL